MKLIDYLSSPPKNLTLVDAEDIDVDWVYSDDFQDKINNVENIFFKYSKLDTDIFDNEGLMSIFGLSRSRGIVDMNKLCIVIEYNDKNDNSLINELYDNLNLWKVPFFISPADNYNEEDYVNYLLTITENILSSENTIIINPVYSFIQYIFSNILVDQFLVGDNNIQNISNPTPPLDIKELFIDKVGEKKANEIKDKILEQISNEDKEKLTDIITNYLNNLKLNLEEQKNNLGLTLTKDNNK